jgi:Domain of unknown function (DUF4271)
LKRHLLFLVFLLISFTSKSKPVGPKNEYQVVYDFKNDWELYNSKLSLFVPYIKNELQKEQAYAIRINLSDYPNAFLIFQNKGPETIVFFDKTLKAVIKTGQWYVFSTDKLKSENKKEEMSIFFYGESTPDEITAAIAFKGVNEVSKTERLQKSLINFLPKSDSPYKSILAFGFLIFIAFTSFLGSSFSKAFVRYFGIGGLFSKIGKDGAFLINKPLDRPNVLFVILTSTIATFLILIFSPSQSIKIYTNFNAFEKWGSFGDYLISYLLILFISLTALILKYFILKIVGNLFSINKLVDLHYFRLIQVTLIFTSFSTILLLANHSLHLFGFQDINHQIIKYILAGFYIFRFLIIFSSLNRIENTNTLYIICYLCIVEFLPIILGFKILV